MWIVSLPLAGRVGMGSSSAGGLPAPCGLFPAWQGGCGPGAANVLDTALAAAWVRGIVHQSPLLGRYANLHRQAQLLQLRRQQRVVVRPETGRQDLGDL